MKMNFGYLNLATNNYFFFDYLSGMKSKAIEFIQYRFPVGGGPSSNI